MSDVQNEAQTDSRSQWVKLLVAGKNVARDGRAFFVRDPGAVVAASLAYAGKTQLPVDYEHQTYHAERNGHPAPAAGWISDLEVRDGDIWGLINWTERAASLIARREYRYISPTLHHKTDGEVLHLVNAGLTNRPALDLLALAAAQDHAAPSVSSPSHDRPGREATGTVSLLATNATLSDVARGDAAIEPGPSDMTISKAILTTLGLGEAASEADVLEAIEKLKAQAKVVPTTLTAMASVVSELSEERSARREERLTAKVEDAIRAGIIPPALRDWGVSLCCTDEEAFDSYAAKVGKPFAHLFKPAISDAMQARIAAERASDSGDGVPSAGVADAVARQLGVDAKHLT